MGGVILSTLVLSAGAFAAAIGLVIALGFVADKSRTIGRWYIPLFIPAVLFAVAFKTLALQRVLTHYSEDTTTILGAPSPLADWVLRAASAFILGTSLAVIIAGLFNQKRINSVHSRLLITGFFLYFFFNIIANGLFGTRPSLDYKLGYYFIVFLAVYLSGPTDINLLTNVFKYSGLTTICSGLVLIFVIPTMVIQPDYRSLFPFVTIRFWGIDAHANGLGPLCAVVALVLMWRPLNHKALQIVFLASAITALFLTQSKTAMGSFISALVVWGIYRFSRSNTSFTGLRESQASLAIIATIALIGSGAVAYWWSGASLISGNLDRTAVEGAVTLTGRAILWDASLSEFKANPLFGYGNLLWGPEFANKYHLLGIASNAHNQIVDVLSAGGVFGLFGFACYLGTLVFVAWKKRDRTEGFSLVLLTFLVMRGIPEVPFKLSNMMSNDFLVHLLLFAILSWDPSPQNPSKPLPKDRQPSI